VAQSHESPQLHERRFSLLVGCSDNTPAHASHTLDRGPRQNRKRLVIHRRAGPKAVLAAGNFAAQA
jgi:hypothetical protein